MESLCPAYIAQQDPEGSSPSELHIGFTYFPDGSVYEDQVVGGWPSGYEFEAKRGYDVTFVYDAAGEAYVKWRVKYLVVNEAGEREIMFWEGFGLRVTGFSELIVFE